jgi:NAD(P)-dependent dehydrogenase (short-subunit alcohol dehydrogenase family)
MGAMKPAGKTVIITGASSGIGAATARVFSEAGARVVLAARNAEALQSVAATLPGPALVVPSDVADREAMRALVATVVRQFGGLDVLINNAGIGLSSPVEQIRPDEFEQVLAVDLLGPLYGVQAALPALRARGRGQIIFVSSVVGVRALPYIGGYAAAKGALERLAESLRVELVGSGITVTVVRPGTTRTGFKANRLGGAGERRNLKRAGVQPERVARAILQAARQEPREAYVTLADRLVLLGASLVPRLVDAVLARAFSWQR